MCQPVQCIVKSVTSVECSSFPIKLNLRHHRVCRLINILSLAICFNLLSLFSGLTSIIKFKLLKILYHNNSNTSSKIKHYHQRQVEEQDMSCFRSYGRQQVQMFPMDRLILSCSHSAVKRTDHGTLELSLVFHQQSWSQILGYS